MNWPKTFILWTKDRVLYVSIPFTWELPTVKLMLQQKGIDWDRALVGGPAVYLMPDYFKGMSHVSIGYHFEGVLQMVNPLATRTTIGCIRKCGFCGVPKFEGKFKELDQWPDLPIICDNNILASSKDHFSKVISKLKKHIRIDFNQGLDSRLLTDFHAKKLFKIRKNIRRHGIRLALDSLDYKASWLKAYEILRNHKIPKSKIGSYALIGFDAGPGEAWERCQWIESHKIPVFPMWYHDLNQLEKNIVTEKQEGLGWSDYERRKIMQWYYRHKKAILDKIRQHNR